MVTQTDTHTKTNTKEEEMYFHAKQSGNLFAGVECGDHGDIFCLQPYPLSNDHT